MITNVAFEAQNHDFPKESKGWINNVANAFYTPVMLNPAHALREWAGFRAYSGEIRVDYDLSATAQQTWTPTSGMPRQLVKRITEVIRVMLSASDSLSLFHELVRVQCTSHHFTALSGNVTWSEKAVVFDLSVDSDRKAALEMFEKYYVNTLTANAEGLALATLSSFRGALLGQFFQFQHVSVEPDQPNDIYFWHAQTNEELKVYEQSGIRFTFNPPR